MQQKETIRRITIDFIPHVRQRYCTSGDWLVDKKHGVLKIRVSRLGRDAYNLAVAFHEAFEFGLCYLRGIDQALVDEWDMAFVEAMKRSRKVLHFQGKTYFLPKAVVQADEPGHHPDAPYHTEHEAASVAERFFIRMAGESWEEYEKSFNVLPEHPSEKRNPLRQSALRATSKNRARRNHGT